MTVLGYHASHEQFAPRRLLSYVREAEHAGFRAAMCSDHFHPWTRTQGESGFTWAWLGAAMATTDLTFGTVTVPGYRYHPAVLAQACATLAQMFPERFWVSMGSGEALNEHITGEAWPDKATRNARLEAAADVVRRLWRGEEVSVEHPVRVDRARLYTRPSAPPPLLGAALTPETAKWLAGWADGLITVSKPLDELEKVVAAWRRGGGEGKPLLLQAQVSWAKDEEEAMRAAVEQWPFVALDEHELATLETPGDFEAATKGATADDLKGVDVSADPEHLVKRLLAYARFGFDAIYVHNVHPDQPAFLEMAARHLVPAFEAETASQGRTVAEQFAVRR